MTITHITEREAALERENAKQLQTIRVQAAAIEAQRECIADLEADLAEYREKYNDAYGALDDCARELAALKAQPVKQADALEGAKP